MSNQNFIVGDAGGTSTQWRVIKNGKVNQFETVGYNAYTHDLGAWKKSIFDSFGEKIVKDMPTYIYAAGVDTKSQVEKLNNSLSDLFGSHVFSENDLLGVARSLCGKESGNVCILGTGANACFYDGNNVDKVSASLGYVLGDEGSGAYLGKILMQKVFRKQLSSDLIHEFQNEFSLDSHAVIQRLYSDEQPNKFLSSFALFIHKHRNHPQIFEMIKNAFDAFFDAFFFNEKNRTEPFHFSGSIAYFFSDILREAGRERGIHIKNIVQSPIAGLVLYHQEND